MTRSQKLTKLGNAIKRLRGLKSITTGKWHTPPNPAAVEDVVRWLQKIRPQGAQPVETYKQELADRLNEILAFKTLGEYEAWMKGFETA